MDLVGTTWEVRRLESEDGTMVPVLDGTTLTFAYDGARVNGNAGCNSYFGPASIGETARLGPLASTMMYCSEPEGVMIQERRFLDLLGEVDSIDGDEAHLALGQGGDVVLEMIRLEADLNGSWSLLFYNTETALVSPIPGTEITATFAEGQIQGSSGCNRYTAGYQADGESLLFSPPAGTKKACLQPEGVMAQETRFLELLATTASYTIRQGRILDLFDGDGLLILQFDRTT